MAYRTLINNQPKPASLQSLSFPRAETTKFRKHVRQVVQIILILLASSQLTLVRTKPLEPRPMATEGNLPQLVPPSSTRSALREAISLSQAPKYLMKTTKKMTTLKVKTLTSRLQPQAWKNSGLRPKINHKSQKILKINLKQRRIKVKVNLSSRRNKSEKNKSYSSENSGFLLRRALIKPSMIS